MEQMHIFIIGSKGIPARYGGYETFVDKLTEYSQTEEIKYHVACMTKERGVENQIYHGADCFYVIVPEIGPAKAVYYDLAALQHCISRVKREKITQFKIYILACRIGPFIGYFAKQIHRLGGELYINPDGHEWMRAKWNAAIKRYWKISERGMVKHADLVICDSRNIENYIQREYAGFQPKTDFIAYGANVERSELELSEEKVQSWYQKHDVLPGEYYLVIGRFVPENNYKTMICEFMRSHTKKDLVLITNIEQNKFFESLLEETGFSKDPRIKFVGTVYDQELLKLIRENAFAYLHGHEVGGTNPSLLEALASTRLNLLLNVGFNREVAEEGALYWGKEEGSLATLMAEAEGLSETEIAEKGTLAVQRIRDHYQWEQIVEAYERTFLQK